MLGREERGACVMDSAIQVPQDLLHRERTVLLRIRTNPRLLRVRASPFVGLILGRHQGGLPGTLILETLR